MCTVSERKEQTGFSGKSQKDQNNLAQMKRNCNALFDLPPEVQHVSEKNHIKFVSRSANSE